VFNGQSFGLKYITKLKIEGIINNGTYANGIDYWSANYSDYIVTKALATNGTFYLDSNPDSFY